MNTQIFDLIKYELKDNLRLEKVIFLNLHLLLRLKEANKCAKRRHVSVHCFNTL